MSLGKLPLPASVFTFSTNCEEWTLKHDTQTNPFRSIPVKSSALTHVIIQQRALTQSLFETASLYSVTKCNSCLSKFLCRGERKEWNQLMPGRKEGTRSTQTVVLFENAQDCAHFIPSMCLILKCLLPFGHIFWSLFKAPLCLKLTAEGPSWKPWTVIRTVSPTLALLGLVDSLGPLGAAGRKV